MITKREKALTHIYPDLAGLTPGERRQLMVQTVGVYSSLQLNQAAYEVLMARLEENLWTRVDRGQCPDPRTCTKCGRPLVRLRDGKGQCPELCQTRKVYAWTRDYWRRKLPREAVSSRQVWKLKQLWSLLVDYLPPDKATHEYLARIILKAEHEDAADLARILRHGHLQWRNLKPKEAHDAIEALKDRLAHCIT